MNKNTLKYIITILIIVSVFTLLYFIIKPFINNKDIEEVEYLKNYGANEYIPTYVSDEDMARIYLNDYVNNMLYNTKEAYYLLDEKYRNKKFGSYEKYYNYVENLNNYDIIMSKFYKQTIKGNVVFGVYDKDNNLYIFKTNGVLQYSVYLDDYTVEIGD